MKKVERHRYKDKKIIQTRTLTFEPYSYDEIDTVIEKNQDNLSSDFLKGKKVLMYPDDIKQTSIWPLLQLFTSIILFDRHR